MKIPKPLPPPPDPDQEVLTTLEAAGYLRISDRTLWDLIQQGDGPPFFKCGKQYRFYKAALQEWMTNQQQEAGAE